MASRQGLIFIIEKKEDQPRSDGMMTFLFSPSHMSVMAISIPLMTSCNNNFCCKWLLKSEDSIGCPNSEGPINSWE